MTLNEQINADFMTAFKEGDKEKKTFLGLLKSEIKNNEARGILPTDENVTSLITKINKSLIETLNAGDESAALEIEWIALYLPQLMSSDEVKEKVRDIINAGADNIGTVMKEFNMKYKGKADNNHVRMAAVELL